jgi:hypothetical protein
MGGHAALASQRDPHFYTAIDRLAYGASDVFFVDPPFGLGPVPVTVAMSTSSSRASLRARGVRHREPAHEMTS